MAFPKVEPMTMMKTGSETLASQTTFEGWRSSPKIYRTDLTFGASELEIKSSEAEEIPYHGLTLGQMIIVPGREGSVQLAMVGRDRLGCFIGLSQDRLTLSALGWSGINSAWVCFGSIALEEPLKLEGVKVISYGP